MTFLGYLCLKSPSVSLPQFVHWRCAVCTITIVMWLNCDVFTESFTIVCLSQCWYRQSQIFLSLNIGNFGTFYTAALFCILILWEAGTYLTIFNVDIWYLTSSSVWSHAAHSVEVVGYSAIFTLWAIPCRRRAQSVCSTFGIVLPNEIPSIAYVIILSRQTSGEI